MFFYKGKKLQINFPFIKIFICYLFIKKSYMFFYKRKSGGKIVVRREAPEFLSIVDKIVRQNRYTLTIFEGDLKNEHAQTLSIIRFFAKNGFSESNICPQRSMVFEAVDDIGTDGKISSRAFNLPQISTNSRSCIKS